MSASTPDGSCCAVADPATVPAAAAVSTVAGDCAHPPCSPQSGGDVDLDAARLMGHPPAARVLPACSAGFSLRIATANVCCFPLLTRNKTAVLQFGAGIVTGMALLRWTISAASNAHTRSQDHWTSTCRHSRVPCRSLISAFVHTRSVLTGCVSLRSTGSYAPWMPLLLQLLLLPILALPLLNVIIPIQAAIVWVG